MSWIVLVAIVLALGLTLFTALSRRAELARMRSSVDTRDEAVRQGSDKAQLQYPVVDLTRCLGCATCVAACPEDGVLELVHGQAMVVRGARCMGVSACERECPVGAITVTLGDVSERTDIPALSEGLEAVGSPGLFLAGEVTAHALIKTAIDHGTAVGTEVARRVQEDPGEEGVLDLCVVGAGPAGLACSLEAKRHGLAFVTLDQEPGPGGTVAKYPRRKLVMTQPVEIPIYGYFKQKSYTKEELIELWQGIAEEQELPLRGGETFEGLERDEGGNYLVRTQEGSYAARNVCLALGRRGTPRTLGVPGEDLPKVANSLIDAHSHQGRRILVVGGGDSAVEAALGLADQPGNEVSLSYRKERFLRIRSRNEDRLVQAQAEGRIRVLTRSRVLAIHADTVELELSDGRTTSSASLPNDEVFVMIGGTPPFELLERSGVSFDAKLIPTEDLAEEGTGLVRALAVGFSLALAALLFALWHRDYYGLALHEKPAHPKHLFLRPGQGLGLWLGIAATGLIGLNLAYLARRSPRLRFDFGSLQVWMTVHIATGILAFLCAMLHGAMAPRSTVGGYAFWAIGVLVLTGAIGRYFYAYIPRAANGRELELAEFKARLGRISEEWDQGHQRFKDLVRTQVTELIEQKRWKGSFFGRVVSLVGMQIDMRHLLQRLAGEGEAQGLTEFQVREALSVAKRAHRAAVMAAHFEDLRAILNTWRYIHRWGSALLVLLVLVHVVYALAYGAFFFGRAGA